MKKTVLALACLFSCVAFSPAEAAWQPQLAVGLVAGQEVLALKLPCKSQIFEGNSPKAVLTLPAGSQLSITHGGSHFTVNGKKLKNDGEGLFIKAAPEVKSFVFTWSQKDFRGTAKVMVRHGKLALINMVDTEDYLKGVVPEEMPHDWPAEALKAQSVAARTYALENRKRHEGEGFDLCATTHCQQYLGSKVEKAAASKAIEATYGEVLTYQGKLINAFFHTDSGGMTEDSENVWGTKLPYLRAVEEKAKYTQPWKKVLTAERVASLAGKGSHKDIGDLKRIELSTLKIGQGSNDRTSSGRVKQVVFVGSKGRAAVSGNDLRSLLGLRSTMFNMKMDHKQVTVEGYGWGHGLGLSQWGARKWAEEGKSYRDILKHYYQHIALKKLY